MRILARASQGSVTVVVDDVEDEDVVDDDWNAAAVAEAKVEPKALLFAKALVLLMLFRILNIVEEADDDESVAAVDDGVQATTTLLIHSRGNDMMRPAQ